MARKKRTSKDRRGVRPSRAESKTGEDAQLGQQAVPATRAEAVSSAERAQTASEEVAPREPRGMEEVKQRVVTAAPRLHPRSCNRERFVHKRGDKSRAEAAPGGKSGGRPADQEAELSGNALGGAAECGRGPLLKVLSSSGLQGANACLKALKKTEQQLQLKRKLKFRAGFKEVIASQSKPPRAAAIWVAYVAKACSVAASKNPKRTRRHSRPERQQPLSMRSGGGGRRSAEHS